MSNDTVNNDDIQNLITQEAERYGKKFMVQREVDECLKKAEKVQNHDLNNCALKTLDKFRSQGNNVSTAVMAQTEMAITILQEDFQRIGRQNLRQFGNELSMNYADYRDLSTQQKIEVKMQQYVKKELSKRTSNLVS